MKTLPINQRDSWSLLPNGKPKNEPTPNAFSADAFPKEGDKNPHQEGSIKHMEFERRKKMLEAPDLEILEEKEDSKAILNGYYTLIIFVTSGMIIGAILATITMYGIYREDIELGNEIKNVNEQKKYMEYQTGQIKNIIKDIQTTKIEYETSVESIGEKVVNRMKLKEAKVVEN